MGEKITITHLDGTIERSDTRTLAEAQADALARIAEQFSVDADGAKIDAGFNYQGKNYQIDAASRTNITGAALAASLATSQSQVYSVAWRASDNTSTAFDAPGMIAFAQAVATYYTTMFYNAVALKAQIAACATNDACDAVDVTQGWPAN